MTGPEEARKGVSTAIREVADAMAYHGIWDEPEPPADAWHSSQPFFADTMTFPQWLRYVLLGRLEDLLALDASMPEYCEVAPMAEEYARVHGLVLTSLIDALQHLDRLVTRSR